MKTLLPNTKAVLWLTLDVGVYILMCKGAILLKMMSF